MWEDDDEFDEAFERSLRGENISIPITVHPNSDVLSKLGRMVDFGDSRSILFGGEPGSGKTSIVEGIYILNLYRWWKRHQEESVIEPYWILRSMERLARDKYAKWRCYFMFIDYGIVIDTATIFGKTNMKYDIKKMYHNINGKQVSYVDIIKSYKPYFTELKKRIDVKSGSDNATNVFRYAQSKAFQHGVYWSSDSTKLLVNKKDSGLTLNETELIDGDEKKYRMVSYKGKDYKIKEYDKKYVKNNPKQLFIHITDHLGKISKGPKASGDKEILDLHSEYMTSWMRDVYEWTTVDIMQLGRATNDTMRQIKLGVDINKADFKGSGDPYENADLVIGMKNPYKYGESSHNGYNINKMVTSSGHNKFRELKVIKSSEGVDDYNIGYYFLGETGFVHELPKGTEMTEEIYNRITNNNWNNIEYNNQ